MASRDAYIVGADHVVEVAGGRMFGPGETIPRFDAKDSHNARLLEDGEVHRVARAEPSRPERKPEKDEEGAE